MTRRVAWYRHDDGLTEGQRYGTLLREDSVSGLSVVAWDDGTTSEVLSAYLEREDESRAWFAEQARS